MDTLNVYDWSYLKGWIPSYLSWDPTEGLEKLIKNPVHANDELVLNLCHKQMALFRVTWAELAEILFIVMDNIGFTLKLFAHTDIHIKAQTSYHL